MFSDYAATKILKILLRQEDIEVFGTQTPIYNSATPPVVVGYTYANELYMGLCLTGSAPVNADTGTTIEAKEPTATEYHRVMIGSLDQEQMRLLSVPTSGGSANAEIIFFPEAVSSWGGCSYYFIADAETGGNILAFGTLSAPISPTTGKVPLIDVGDLELSFTGLSDVFAEDILDILACVYSRLTVSTEYVYLGLCTSAPIKTDTGTSVATKEPSNGYSRVLLNLTSEPFTQKMSTVSLGDSENSEIIFFPIVRTGGWGTITHFVITDAVEDGNVLAFGSLTSFTPSVDSVPLVRASDLTITFNS